MQTESMERITRSDGFEALARFGLVARGVVYAIIGLLALLVALEAGGRATDQRGALEAIADKPFGTVLVVALAIGLAGYALWRLSRAALGRGKEQRDEPADRVAALASGIAYLILCATAVGIVVGGGRGGGGGPKETTGGVLGWSGGTWLVGAAGVVLIGYGLIHAAVSFDAQKAIGLDGALRQLGRASYGPWLLGIVAAGLIGFAAFSIADARYRKV